FPRSFPTCKGGFLVPSGPSVPIVATPASAVTAPAIASAIVSIVPRWAFHISFGFWQKGLSGHLLFFGPWIESHVLDIDDIAHIDHLGDIFGPFPGQFGYVQQYFVPRGFGILNNGPEFQYLDDLHFIYTAHFGLEHNGFDLGQYGIDPSLVRTKDLHDSFLGIRIFVDHNGGLGLFLKALDDLSSLPDQGPDIFSGDGACNDFWCVGFDLRSWFRNGLGQKSQNMEPSVPGLFKGLDQDFIGKSLDLDVHLTGGDPISGTGDLEVHIPQMVLIAQNVRKYGMLAAFGIGDQSHGDSGNRFLELYPGIHEGHGSRTY